MADNLVMTISDDEEGAVASDGSDDDDFALSTAAGESSRRAVASAPVASMKRSKAKKDKGSGSSGTADAADGGIAADLIADVDGAHGHAGATAAVLATGGGLSGRQLSLDAKLRARAAELAPVDEPDLDGYDEEEGEAAAPVLKEVRLGKKAREAAAAKEARSTAAAQSNSGAASAGAEGGHGAVAKGKKTAGADIGGTSAKDGAVVPAKPTTFKELGLSVPLLKAIQELGFSSPTPIQAAVIPAALRGIDICGSAVTGSGKTAAFLLPILERLHHRSRRAQATRALVLCPTRELAAQGEGMGRRLGVHCDARFALVVGGLSSQLQEAELRTRPEVVVATPGRMLDLLRNSPSVGLEGLEVLVLDEADRLLDLGFRQEVEELVRLCPTDRQTMLFSATITEEVAELANVSLKAPLQVRVDTLYGVAERLQQEFVRLKPGREHEREALLLALASRTYTSRAIVFVASKARAHRLRLLFGLAHLRAAELHGNLTQLQRLQALDAFRLGQADFLIATDLASRGLDIRGVTTVINFELPSEMATYVHRVGRTARAGDAGRACSLVGEGDRSFLKQVLRHARGVVKSRAVPPVAVAHWAARVGGMEAQVRAVLAEEEEDKALRVAEMEANKASNLIDHQAEIMARPAKSWFQTPAEKAATKAAALLQPQSTPAAEATARRERIEAEAASKAAAAAEKKAKVKRDKYAGMPRKKRRHLQRLEAWAQQGPDEADEAGGAGGDTGDAPAKKKKARGADETISAALGLPNQKLFARQAKAVERKAVPGAKRANPFTEGGQGKRRAQPDKPAAAERDAAAKARAKAKAERALPARKVRSRSKPKFSKARKR